MGYAFYAEWRVALLILAAVPIVSLVSITVISLNQKKGQMSSASYKKAGSTAYSAVAAIKTVLSLNGTRDMVLLYQEATQEAYKASVQFLLKLGFASGSMMGSFLFFYFVLTLFGSYLIYRQVRTDGCDPSGAVPNNGDCTSTGADVFGAMLGIAFAAQVSDRAFSLVLWVLYLIHSVGHFASREFF
jgi:ATP-binding cassette subfamily B (MDR/TAP) protein 1